MMRAGKKVARRRALEGTVDQTSETVLGERSKMSSEAVMAD